VFVQQALKQIKESVGDQEFSFKTSKDTDANQLQSETECLSILGEEINKTRIIYFTKEMQQAAKHTYSFKFNKNELKDYASKAGVIKQRGLVHYNKKGISDFMILIDEEDEVKFEKQRDLLKKYLGIGGGGIKLEIKKTEQESDEEFGEISDLPPSIAPSNGSNNFRGGTFGCTRILTDPIPSRIAKFSSRCNSVYKKGIYYRYHAGIDVSMPFGTEIKSILSGTVESEPIKNDFDKKGLGSNIIIKSKTKTGIVIYYHYCHLLQSSLNLKKGDIVKRGQVIAVTGKTGNIATIKGIETNLIQQHCHIEVYEGEGNWSNKDKRVNPKKYLNNFLKAKIEQYE
jgi:murein DD-endopeptidase MepM/ murein hydrolase activator NlpD